MSDIDVLFIALMVLLCMIFMGVYELYSIHNALCNIDYDLVQANMMQYSKHHTIEVVKRDAVLDAIMEDVMHPNVMDHSEIMGDDVLE